jgi:hypothetical protein
MGREAAAGSGSRVALAAAAWGADSEEVFPSVFSLFFFVSSPLFCPFFFLLCLFSSLFIGKNGAGAPSITQRLVGQ